MSNPGSPDSPFRLIGAERSYFTGKVRPALLAKPLYFDEELTSPDAYREIRERTGLMFIPIVVTPEDETWQDTSEILDALEARFPEPALLPQTPVQRVVASILELYGDEFMVLPAMHYRWTAPESEADARAAFAAMSGSREAADRFADQMSGSLPALGVGEKTIPGIVAHTDDLLAAMDALLSDQDFFLGGQLSIADCAMMGPFYAHLYLDLVPGQIVRERSPAVAHWIEHCNHPSPRSFTGFLADDALHPALRDVLTLVGRDAIPMLLDAARAFDEWADTRPGDLQEPPRAVGFHDTSLRGVAFQRYTSAYLPWMLQRPLDTYRALDDAGRAAVDAALSGTGCEALLAHAPRHRLGKRDFKLVFEDD